MPVRTTRRAFDRRARGIKTGLLTLFAVSAQVGALLVATIVLPPQIAAWRSRRAVDEAASLAAKGKKLEAIFILRHAIALDPKNAKAHFNLGILELAANDDIDAAAKQFETAAEIDDRFGRAYYNLGVIQLYYQYKSRLAAESFTHAARLEPDYGPAWLGVGLARESLGEYGVARHSDIWITLEIWPCLAIDSARTLIHSGSAPNAAQAFSRSARFSNGIT